MTDAPESASDSTTTARALRRSTWSSLLALMTSVFALAVGAYQTSLMQSQTRLMQTQARASVWPHVSIGYNYHNSGDDPGFELHVQNNGVGPALVRSVQTTLDGAPVRHWTDLFKTVFEKNQTVHADLSGLQGIVIPPNTNRDTLVPALKITDADFAKRVYDLHDRIDMRICYCSIYDDCWIATMKTAQPMPTPACAQSQDEFDY
ncbi:MAG TPA: hypothetical protein VF132_08605 [Rudaea sp.]